MIIFFRSFLVFLILLCPSSFIFSKTTFWPWWSHNNSEWTSPAFSEKKSILGHIFRDEEGHLQEDTPAHRQYILGAVASSENRVAINNYGTEIYLKVMPDGRQAWAYVRNGIIENGGCNPFPLKWVEDSKLASGGDLVPIKYDIKKRCAKDLKVSALFIPKMVQELGFGLT